MTELTIRMGDVEGNPPGYPVTFFVHEKGKLKPIPPTGSIPASNVDEFVIKLRKDLLENRGTNEDFKSGGFLLHKVLRAAIGDGWIEYRKAGPCRTYLDIVPSNLARAPWELLSGCFPADRPWLFFDSHHPIVRVRCFRPNVSAVRDEWPIRILLVVGAKDGDPKVDAESELSLITKAVREVDRLIDLAVLRRPKNMSLMAEIKAHRPHILHFIGHAGKSPEGLPRLFFDLPNPDAWSWTTDDIQTRDLPAVEWKPHLVVLNACRTTASGATSMENQQEVESLGDAFLEAGCLAVLGMQADVRGSTAGVYSGDLYKGLANGVGLDAALADARGEVSRQSNYRDGCLATLTLTVPPQAVVPAIRPVAPERLQLMEDCERLRIVKEYVNHTETRRQVMRGFSPLRLTDRSHSLLVISGSPSVGKTALACWLLEGSVRLDHRVRYIEIADKDGKNWLDIIRLIRDGGPQKPPCSPIAEPFPPEAFYAFNWDLNYRMQGKEPETWVENTVANDDAGPLIVDRVSGNFLERTFDRFWRALEKVVEAGPVTIVLDHFRNKGSALPVPDYRILRKYFLNRVARGEMKHLRCLLLFTEDEYQDFEVAPTDDDLNAVQFLLVPIPKLPRHKFFPLAEEFVDRKRPDKLDDMVRQVIRLKEKEAIPDPWEIGRLPAFWHELARMFNW